MNDKIKQKFPKASEVFQEWSADDNEFIIYADPRCLYDFFDEQGIYINIEIVSYDAEFYFIPDILTSGLKNISNIGGAMTRTEAEEKAFEKAFSILEDKL